MVLQFQPMSPPAIVVFVAWCSLITHFKSTLELLQRAKKNLAGKNEVKRETRVAKANLHKAYNYGLISATEYDQFYELFNCAETKNERKYCKPRPYDPPNIGSKLW